MPIAAPDNLFDGEAGGAVSTGARPGVYHVECREASRGESKTSKRSQFILDLFGKDDPNNTSKEGKRIIKMFQSLAIPSDDEDKRQAMRGVLKRLCYEGFSVPWPEKTGSLDPRRFQGKTAWILVDKVKDNKEQMRSQVVAVAQEREQLPVIKTTSDDTVGAAPARRRQR